MDQLAKATDHAHQIFDTDAVKLLIADRSKLDPKLLDYAAGLLDNEKQLPRGLGMYVAHALRLHAHKLSGTPARAEETNLWRDALVEYAVHQMRQFGFKPTRNREQKRKEKDSGCSIVTKALNRQGFNLTERTVKGIWQGRSKAQRNRRRQALIKALLTPRQKPAPTANYLAGLFSPPPSFNGG
jgi:hypothetical protein